MPHTIKDWKFGDKARLSPVMVGGKPEFFQHDLVRNFVRIPAKDIPDGIVVVIVDVRDIWVRVKIAEEGSTLNGAWADVILTQLHCCQNTTNQ